MLLPVDALDPPAQVLADVHGERVIVQLVHLLQVLTVQHLELAPLRHLLVDKSSYMRVQGSKPSSEPKALFHSSHTYMK